MVKTTLLWLQISFAVITVLSKTIVSSKEFIHIGSFKSTGMRVRRSAENFDENDYYVSLEPAAWSSSQADCKNNFGADASLIAIESIEEWNFLRENLESYGGTTFWTSGMYDPTASAWRWTANNNILPPFAPWDSGYPKTPNPSLRVLLYHTNRYNAAWRTAVNTQLHHYICEVQKITVAVPCYITNDLVVVLDSSGSITSQHYETAKNFVEQLAAAFTVHSPSRFAFIIYSDIATEIISIQNILTPAAIRSTILSTPYMNSGTNTWLGVNLAVSQFQSSFRQVPLNMVVLTDGISNILLTSAAAAAATTMGIRSFSVGITSNVNNQELLALAGGNSSRVYYSANFDELINILAPLSVKICSTN